jgi:GntR family transcriptional regulator
MNAKWAAVADRLRSDITAGRLRGELPSEAVLMDEYAVSRTTIRHALAQLSSEGLIESSQGSRRQVRQDVRWRWPMHLWERNHDEDADAWARSIMDQGGTPESEVRVAVEECPPDVAEALEVPVGSSVVVRRRTRSVDGEVHQLADSYFPYELVRDHPVFLQPGDQSAKGGLLTAAGMPQARFRDVVESRMPTPDESRILRIPTGTPLLVHRRTGYTKDGQAVRHMITRMSANRVEISYEVEA